EAAVETLQHGVVAAALELEAELAQAPLLVELGIPAARHVEAEAVAGFFEDLQLEAAARAAPYFLRDAAQPGHVVAEALGRLDAVRDRGLFDESSDHLARR